MAHPRNFHLVHVTFPMLPGQPWGDLSDGPADQEEALTKAADHFVGSGCDPSLENLWVYQFQDDAPPRDVTEDFIDLVNERLIEGGHRDLGWAAE